MIRLCAFADEADVTIKGQIAALKRNGISLIEVRGINGTNVADLTDEQATAYAKEYADNGIKVWSVGSPLGKTDVSADYDAFMAKCKRVFEIANIFQAKNVRVFSFYNAYESEEEVFRRLTAATDLAKEYGLTLCHENEKEIYGDVLFRVKRVLENVPNLKSVFDPANFVEVGEDAETALNELAPYTYYYHVKDTVRETEEKVPAGMGDGAIPSLIRQAAERDTVLTVEPHLAIFEGYAQIDNTEMKGKFTFKDNHEAFDTAVTALKNEILKAGLKPVEGGFEK